MRWRRWLRFDRGCPPWPVTYKVLQVSELSQKFQNKPTLFQNSFRIVSEVSEQQGLLVSDLFQKFQPGAL
jgi:hypothetical protein